MKVGIELQIDVTKIEKHRIYQGKKGKYLTMTAFVDLDNKDQYDQNGMITHKKEENEQQAPILGNTKVFWTDGQQQAPAHHSDSASYQASPSQAPAQGGLEDDDFPF
ncbi:MAG: hypothetical protein JKY52_09115 [Flavobacteriales bacterium]|nr:hypothetical protein [Flavobacteriales bacterium]